MLATAPDGSTTLPRARRPWCYPATADVLRLAQFHVGWTRHRAGRRPTCALAAANRRAVAALRPAQGLQEQQSARAPTTPCPAAKPRPVPQIGRGFMLWCWAAVAPRGRAGQAAGRGDRGV